MRSNSNAKIDFPLHWAVYINNLDELRKLLDEKNLEIDKIDIRGRSPLMLAVTIGHRECAKLLLKAGANADSHNKQMWSISNEAVSLADPELLREIIHHRDYQRSTRGAKSMRETLEKLRDSPDFFCEMNWDFSSWVPFLTQACPSDTYKIYKKGSNVRIDTTLVSFEGTSWTRGNQSFMFRINSDGFPEFVVLDHKTKTASRQALRDDEPFDDFSPTAESIGIRLTTPISTTFIDVDQIGFERTSRGLLSWFNGACNTEKIDGFDCKVLAASNVQMVTKKRTEHLSVEDRQRIAQEEANISAKAVSSIMKMLQSEKSEERTSVDLFRDQKLTPEKYFDAEYDFGIGMDIGRPKEVTRKSNAFKATLWMADRYPLNLQEQIVPIIELMAVNSPHFARLHNFIRLQLPSGFPAKIEIPLFHVLSARIMFQNVNRPGKYVTPLDAQEGTSSVIVDDEAFEIPSDYYSIAADDTTFNITWEDENDRASRGRAQSDQNPRRFIQSDEMLLQLAIEQSLLESRSGANCGEISDEQLARALQAQFDSEPSNRGLPPPYQPSVSTEYMEAVRISQIEDEQRRKEELEYEDELRKVLELSKLEL